MLPQTPAPKAQAERPRGNAPSGARQVNVPDFTIAICTRGNPGQLGELLASLAAMDIPSGVTWEVLIADNCGSPATAATIAAWRVRLPLRSVRAIEPGVARSRNVAKAAARGRWLCWVDDDVIVPSDWLAIWHQAIGDHPEAAVFGGRIIPDLGPGPPSWCLAEVERWPLSSICAHRDLGQDLRPLAPTAAGIPWGANLAIRAAELARYHYDPLLDWGEETDLVARMLGDGALGWWLPQSQVRHVIRPDRLSRAYIARYFHRNGWCAAYRAKRDQGRSARLAGADGWLATPSWLLVGLATACRIASRVTPFSGPSLRNLARASYMQGVLRFRRGLPESSPDAAHG